MRDWHIRQRIEGKPIKAKLTTIVKKLDNLLDREMERLDKVDMTELEDIRRALHAMLRKYS